MLSILETVLQYMCPFSPNNVVQSGKFYGAAVQSRKFTICVPLPLRNCCPNVTILSRKCTYAATGIVQFTV